MDLLYALQNIRETGPSWINTFLVLFSEGNILATPILAACMFWCGDKKKGRYIMTVFTFAFLLNGILKLTFCVYRPWILDARLYCAPEAVEEATGYSFPSAHCTMMASILGSIAYAYREKKWLTPFAIVVTAFMMFARMYLGCHTLLDVTVGVGLGLAFLFLLRPMLTRPYEEVGTGKITLLLLAVLALATALYTRFKGYPTDLAEDGSLLVDPYLMMQDTFAAIGVLIGVTVGNLLDIRCIRFPEADTGKKRLARGLIGGIGFALLYAVIMKKLMKPLDPNFGKFMRYLVSILWVTAGFPAIIKASKGRL